MINPMKSALLAILGVSLLAANVGCDSGSDDNGGNTAGTGPLPVGGTSATAGTGAIPTSGTGTGGTTATGGTGGGGGGLPSGVPLTPTNGWIAADSNALMVQGAMFSYADDFSLAGPPEMVSDFTLSNACIKGVAAKVDMTCTKPAGMDCYGVYWGAAIGLNLNQPSVLDPTTMMEVGGDPMAFDASSVTAFAFEIAAPAGGAGMIPTSLRFKVDDGDPAVEYCTGAEVPVKLGANVVKLDQLRTKCWEALTKQPTPVTATTVKNKLVKIAWQVVTNDKATVPFDFCVNNVRAIQ